MPGIWPAVPIDGRTYFDGGFPSPDNAVLAAGARAVLLLSPMGGSRSGRLARRLLDEAAELEREGATVTIVTPDADATDAMGRRSLDPSRRAIAAEAGRKQGRATADAVREGWR